MKKKNIIIIIIAMISVVVVGMVIVKENKVRPPGVVYCLDSFRTYNDEGLYYFNGQNYLMFLDNATGKKVPVCAKAECKHDNQECDAYYGESSLALNILLYGDDIFISYFYDDKYIDSDGEEKYRNAKRIERLNKDGSNRRVIYQNVSGAVHSMLAVDGKLYFTAYDTASVNPMELEINFCSNYLYCYDMNWGIMNEMLEFTGDEKQYNMSLYLLDSLDTEKLHLLCGYRNGVEDESESICRLITMDMKGNICSEELLDSGQWWSLFKTIKVNHNSRNIYYSDGNFHTDTEYMLYRIDEDGNIEKLLDEGIRFNNRIGGGELCYFYIDEKKRVLLDFEKNQNYISRSAVSDAHIVPDIFLVDKKNDIVYYDLTDYTGVEDGAAFTEWPCQEACMKWSEFLETYFVPYEGHELEEIHICGSGENGN